MNIVRITDEVMVRSLTMLGDETINKIIQGNSILLGMFAKDGRLITTSVMEQSNLGEIKIQYLYTDPDYRELGHARAMISEIERITSQGHGKRVVIEYTGPKGSYDEAGYIFGKLKYDSCKPIKTVITLSDLTYDSKVISEDEIKAQMKFVKYKSVSLDKFVGYNKKLSEFVKKTGIEPTSNGQLAFVKNDKVLGTLFFGNVTDKAITVQEIYIDKDASKKEMLFSFICLISSLNDVMLEKNLPLKLSTADEKMPDVLRKIFLNIDSEEESGLFIKNLL